MPVTGSTCRKSGNMRQHGKPDRGRADANDDRDFIRLARALDTDVDGLLGIVPVGEADKKYRNILYQISHLKTHEQKIVLRMVEVLADEATLEQIN